MYPIYDSGKLFENILEKEIEIKNFEIKKD